MQTPPTTRRATHPRGFTLVEMLLVVSLIVLLISMLLPGLQRSREAAHRAVCATMMAQANVGLGGYILDHLNRYPKGNATIARGAGIDSTYIVAANLPLGMGWVIQGGYASASTFYCPSWSHPWNQLGVVDLAGDDDWFGPGQMGGWPAGETGGPSSHRGISYHYRSSFGPDSDRPPSASLQSGDNAIMADHFSRREVLYGREFGHRDGYNALFLDGSAAWRDDPNSTYMDEMQPPAGYITNGNWALQELIWQQFFEQ